MFIHKTTLLRLLFVIITLCTRPPETNGKPVPADGMAYNAGDIPKMAGKIFLPSHCAFPMGKKQGPEGKDGPWAYACILLSQLKLLNLSKSLKQL